MSNYHTYIVTDDGAIIESSWPQSMLAAQVAHRINLTRGDMHGRPIAVLECDGRETASARVGSGDLGHGGPAVDCAGIILHMMLCGGWRRRDLTDAMKTHAGIILSRSRAEQWMRRGSGSVTMQEVALVAQVLCDEAMRREREQSPMPQDL